MPPRRRTAACLVLLVGINLLVVVKYGVRTHVPALLLAGVYVAVIAAGTWASCRWAGLARGRWRIALPALVVVASVVLSLAVLARVDPATTRVDRWSAITAFNDRLLSGQFPYEARTHLGSRISGLPVLFLIGLPFQWAGDVGLVQPVVLILFAVVAIASWGRRRDTVWPLLFLVTSPAFAWEVAARSDLLSNALLVVLAFVLCERWRGRSEAARVAAVAIVGGLSLGTRLAFAIPWIAYSVGYLRRNPRAGCVAAAGAAAVVAATLAPFAAWDWQAFAANNPLTWQASLSPVVVQAAAVVAAVALGWTADDICGAAFAGGLVVTLSVAAAFALAVARVGFSPVLWGPGPFDISYFDLAVPFLLVPLLHARPVEPEAVRAAGAAA